MRAYSVRQLLGGVDASFARAATAPTPASAAPADAPLAVAAKGPEPQRAQMEQLGGLARIFLGLLAGTTAAIIVELRFLDDWPSRVLALSATVLMAVVAFVFLGFFSGRIKGPMAERMLGRVMKKVAPLGQGGGAGAEEEAETKPRREARTKALKPTSRKRAEAPEAPQLESRRRADRGTGEPREPVGTRKRK